MTEIDDVKGKRRKANKRTERTGQHMKLREGSVKERKGTQGGED